LAKRSDKSSASDRSFDSYSKSPNKSASKATKKNPLDDIKKMDLLTLKKQVIEEIKTELEISKHNPSSFKQDQTKVLEQ